MIQSLAPCFTGNLVWFKDRLVLQEERPASLTGAEMLEPHAARRVIDCFAAAYPDGDRRAVVSLWTQWYFAVLVIPTVAAVIRLRRDLPLEIDRVGIALGDDGQPEAIILEHDGAVSEDGAACLFSRLVVEHLDPLVASLCGTFGVAPRLLWSNAAAAFEWTLLQTELQIAEYGDRLEAGRRLLAARTSDGRPNPLCDPVRYPTENGAPVRRRKICCLRYLLPGEEHCGSLCPLPDVRKNGR